MFAANGLGVGIPVLRMMHFNTVRTIIAYASHVLLTCSDAQLRRLESVQNELVRIVLGCPKTTGKTIIGMELDLLSITSRNGEITASVVLRMISNGTCSFIVY